MSTDSHPQHGANATTGGSSVETMSQPEQNDSRIDEPFLGQEFESEAAALDFYCTYATRMGFVTRMRDHNCSQRDGSIISRTLVCNKEGYRKPRDRPQTGRIRKPKAITRVGCKARVFFKKQKKGTWVIRSLVKEHTHPLSLAADQVANEKNPKIYQIPSDDNRVQELNRQLMLERKRSASLREFIYLLFNHIEEYTQGLSEKVQYIVEKVNKIESEEKTHEKVR